MKLPFLVKVTLIIKNNDFLDTKNYIVEFGMKQGSTNQNRLVQDQEIFEKFRIGPDQDQKF